jgi:hypothetical protein
MHDALVLPSLFPTPGAFGRTELREAALASTRDCQRRFDGMALTSASRNQHQGEQNVGRIASTSRRMLWNGLSSIRKRSMVPDPGGN